MNVKFHKITSSTWNFQKFTCIFTILVKFDIYFLGIPWEIVFCVITDNKFYLYPLISEAIYSACLSASVDNTLLDLHNSPYHVQPHYGS